MLLFVVAHKVWWFSVLTLFCDVFVWFSSQRAIVSCFDLVLWRYCLLLLTICDGLGFDLILLLIVAHKVWLFSVWHCFVMLLFVVATKCDGIVFWPAFVMLLFLVAHKVRWFSVFDLVLWIYCLLLLTKCNGLVFWPYLLLFVNAHKVWWFSVLTLFCDVSVWFSSQSVMV